MRHISGKNVTLSHTKMFVLTCDVFCHILPEKRHILAPPVQNFFEREEMWRFGLDSKMHLSCRLRFLTVFSHISEAWSGQAFWARTDPYLFSFFLSFVISFVLSFFLDFFETSVCETWVCMCMAHSMNDERHDAMIWGTWLMRESIWVTWLIPMCAMTHSYVCHDSFLCVTRLIPMCAITHTYVMSSNTLSSIHTWDMTHS